MTDKVVHEINNSSGTEIISHEIKEANCWWCGSKLIWQSDFMKHEWGMNGEGMVSILICSGCGAECRMIEPEEESEP